MTRQEAAQQIAETAAAKLFALPAGTRVKLMFQNDRVWEGEIVKQGAQGCDCVGRRNARRPIVRNENTGIAYFIEMRGYSAPTLVVMAVEVI